MYYPGLSCSLHCKTEGINMYYTSLLTKWTINFHLEEEKARTPSLISRSLAFLNAPLIFAKIYRILRLQTFKSFFLHKTLPFLLYHCLRTSKTIEIIYRLFDNKFQHFVYLRVNTCYFHTGKILHFKKQIILLGYHWHLFVKCWFCKRFYFQMQTFHSWGNVWGCLKKMRTTFSMR